MKLPNAQTTSKTTLQEILELADALNVDLLSCPQNYRGHNTSIVVLCGPDTNAYLQALARTRELLAEDADLIED